MNMPKKLPELSKMTHEEKDDMIRLLFEAIIELRGKASKNSRNRRCRKISHKQQKSQV